MSIESKIEDVRKEFPALKYMTFLNSAAHGPTLKRVRDAIDDWWNFATYENTTVKPPDAKKEAAKNIHASTDEICWINRVSQGVNMVASMMPLKKGDNIIYTDLGYPSNIFSWLKTREKGVELRRVKHKDGIIKVSDFEKEIDDKTRLITLSHIEWTSGLCHDVKQISEIAHEHGALVLDDGYQASGAINVDVHESDVDIYITGSGKWFCCPCMIGIFYIKKSLISEFEPTYRLYTSVEEAFKDGAPWETPDHDIIASYDKPLIQNAEKFYRGIVSEEHQYGFHACLEYFNKLGSKQIGKRTRELSSYLIEGLKEQDLTVNTPENPEKRGGLVTYTTKRFKKNKEIYEKLRAKKIIVAHRYAGGIGGIRVSTHFFNTKNEIDKLLETQKPLLL